MDCAPLLHDCLTGLPASAAAKVALVCAGQRISYGEIEQRSDALAHTLRDAGVGRGDRVLILGANTAETVVAFWAVLKADAVASLINPLTLAGRLQHLVDDCSPAALITEGRLQDTWMEASRSPHIRSVIVCGEMDRGALAHDPRYLEWKEALAAGGGRGAPRSGNIDADLAAIIYTSGSTGEPKGVMLTHRNMLAAAASVSAYLGLREDDIILNALPLSFNYGLYQMIMAFRQGARLVLENSFSFPAQVLQAIVRERVTVLPGVPTMFSILAAMESVRELDLSAIRLVTNTAAALEPRHVAALRRIFPGAGIFSMYGLTECKRCSYLPPADLDRKPGSVGIAIPNTEMWIVDEAGRRLPANTIGELVVRGATVMKGYWGKPEATAQRLRPGPVPGEQVFHTGDYCRMDEEGYLYFIGRMDDIVKSGGRKIAPKEIEAALAGIEGIREAAVIGVPDELLGEAIKAFVVLEDGAGLSPREIQRRCRQKLEGFLVPGQVELVADLPRTDNGKVRKAALR